jgi:hypothetical protein
MNGIIPGEKKGRSRYFRGERAGKDEYFSIITHRSERDGYFCRMRP